MRWNILTLVMAATLASSSAWAGYDYIQYNRDFRAQKELQKAPEPGGDKTFRHTSKYIREQKEHESTMMPTSQEPKPGQKYEHLEKTR